MAAVLVPVLRRKVHRQKRATGASRSGKAAGPDNAGTLTSGAVSFLGTRLYRDQRDFARSPSPVLEPPAMPGKSEAFVPRYEKFESISLLAKRLRTFVPWHREGVAVPVGVEQATARVDMH